MERHIIPAIIPGTVEEIGSKVALLGGSPEWIQIDVTDGVFAPTTTWPYIRGGADELKSIPALPKVEVHLMIENPERVIKEWVHAGVSRILIHQESTKEFGLILDSLAGTGIEVGVVLKLDTPIETLDPWIDRISLVQLMSIREIGAYGEPFSQSVIPKIQSLRLRYPNLTIEVDGGVTKENASLLFESGVSNLVVGSAIFKSENPLEAFKEFLAVAR